MRVIKGSVIGLVLAGMALLAPAGAFARGAGGGGHSFGGDHFAAGRFGGFAGHSSDFHGGAHYATHGWHGGHWYGSPAWDGIWWDGEPYWEVDPYYSYYDANSSAYSEAAPLQPEATSSRDTVIAVQQKLARLGYYHGPVDGIMGPKTRQAVRWFQSVNKLPVTSLVDGATLKGLQIS